ncbi:speckle-type POZ protein-like [Chironomus tepperi]|uniref:speckle-type POZ protein-like n=1 Tax=Chironomus tepperi TaxID=113505 RepID=UPI00391F9A20
MELDEVTLEIPNPQTINENSNDTDTSSEVTLFYNDTKAMHLEFLIDPDSNKPCMRLKFLEEPIHDIRLTTKQIFSDGRTNIIDVEEIPLDRMIGDDEQLYIRKNSMEKLEPGSDFRFACDIRLTKADKTLLSRFSSSTVERISEIANDQKFLDFTIKFKDAKELKVLKFILASKSPVFLKIFTTDMLESRRNEIFIPDVDYEVMKIAVNFMYNGGVQNLEYHIFDVLIVADKYDIAELKRYCEIEVAKGLTPQIIADVLIFADRYNAALLKERSIQYIQRNWNAIKGLEEFECIYTYSNLILDIFETFSIGDCPIKSVISNL